MPITYAPEPTDKAVDHRYTCDPQNARDLIEWLMSKGYWLECASRGRVGFSVVCGVSPEALTKAKFEIKKG